MYNIIRIVILFIVIIAYQVFTSHTFGNAVEIILQVVIGALIVVVFTPLFGIAFCIIKNRGIRFLTTLAISLAVSFLLYDSIIAIVFVFADGVPAFSYVLPAMGIICLVVTAILEWHNK